MGSTMIVSVAVLHLLIAVTTYVPPPATVRVLPLLPSDHRNDSVLYACGSMTSGLYEHTTVSAGKNTLGLG